MMKNDYRRSLIMLRALERGYSGHVRLEHRTLTGSMVFVVTAPSGGTLCAALVRWNSRGEYAAARLGELRRDSRGQATLAYSFDPRSIDGHPLSDYSLIAVTDRVGRRCDMVLAGNLNGSRETDWNQARIAACTACARADEPAFDLPFCPGACPARPNYDDQATPLPDSVLVEPGDAPTPLPDSVPVEPGDAPTPLPDSVPVEPGDAPAPLPDSVPVEPGDAPAPLPDSVPVEPGDAPTPLPDSVPVEPGDAPAPLPDSVPVEGQIPEGTFSGESAVVSDASDSRAEPPLPPPPVFIGPNDSFGAISAVSYGGADDGALNPTVVWPGESEALRSYFAGENYSVDAPDDGYLYVEAPMSEESGYDSLRIGVRPENGVPESVAYALPGRFSAEPPEGLEDYEWSGDGERGWWIAYLDAASGRRI